MVVICSVFFIPESPRFLMANGKEQEALDFLVKYHGGGDRNSKLVALEYAEFKEGISQTGSDKRWWDCECTGAGCVACILYCMWVFEPDVRVLHVLVLYTYE